MEQYSWKKSSTDCSVGRCVNSFISVDFGESQVEIRLPMIIKRFGAVWSSL
jgi:hypothetical protein